MSKFLFNSCSRKTLSSTNLEMISVVFALAANFFFSVSTLFFSYFSKRTSTTWMNFYKSFVAFISFSLVLVMFNLWVPVQISSILLWSLSGVMGLVIGDYFLLESINRLGPGRALMLDGFQPVLVGMVSVYLLGHNFPQKNFIAIIFLLSCLFTFSFESFKQSGHWELKGLVYALIGTSLEGTSMIFARRAFDISPSASPFLGNFFRTLAALIIFIIIYRNFNLFRVLKNQFSLKEKLQVTLTCFCGTFLALSSYLFAVKSGHMPTISAIAVTAPLFASIAETIIGHRKVTKYLIIGLVFFICGFLVLLLM